MASKDAEEEPQGFADKMKKTFADVQEGMGPAIANAKVKAAEQTAAIQEKYIQFKADMAPKLDSAKESMGNVIDTVGAKVGDVIINADVAAAPVLGAAHSWSSNVMQEWQEPYNGKIFQACFCTLSLCDFTWPDALGLRYKGLCCCIDGECTMCIYKKVEGVDKERPFSIAEFDLMYIKPPYFNKDADGEGTKGGSLCKSVCHCCCLEERFAFPQDEEVPMMFGTCCIVSKQAQARVLRATWSHAAHIARTTLRRAAMHAYACIRNASHVCSLSSHGRSLCFFNPPLPHAGWTQCGRC